MPNFELLKRVGGHKVAVPAFNQPVPRATGYYTIESVYAFLQDCFGMTQAQVAGYVHGYHVKMTPKVIGGVGCWSVVQAEFLLYLIDCDGHVAMPRYMA
jgi:ABC-type transporter Mla maintaining outer membrane lipid asymmetry permease subunit MlaE